MRDDQNKRTSFWSDLVESMKMLGRQKPEEKEEHVKHHVENQNETQPRPVRSGPKPLRSDPRPYVPGVPMHMQLPGDPMNADWHGMKPAKAPYFKFEGDKIHVVHPGRENESIGRGGEVVFLNKHFPQAGDDASLGTSTDKPVSPGSLMAAGSTHLGAWENHPNSFAAVGVMDGASRALQYDSEATSTGLQPGQLPQFPKIPGFELIAKDQTAIECIQFWISRNIVALGSQHEKILRAQRTIDEFRAWQVSNPTKQAD